jgi:Flp pilus assembly protein TadB
MVFSFVIFMIGLVLLVVGSDKARSNAVVSTLLANQDATVQPRAAAVSSAERYERPRLVAWFVGAVFMFLLRRVLGVVLGPQEVLFVLLGGLAGELWYRRRKERRAARLLKSMELNLPMTMERIVMAVGSGLDIVPALREASSRVTDPVSVLLSEVVDLAEAGLPVADSLRSVSRGVPCSAVKHCFVHLALAYQQGGELVRPLKELSDATQTYYQESVEEEIAKLPVKAVLPLVLTFAGLIVCFLTIPLIQVGSLTSKVSNAALDQ